MSDDWSLKDQRCDRGTKFFAIDIEILRQKLIEDLCDLSITYDMIEGSEEHCLHEVKKMIEGCVKKIINKRFGVE